MWCTLLFGGVFHIFVRLRPLTVGGGALFLWRKHMANIIESTVVNVRVGVKSALESLESKGSKYKPRVRKYEVLTGKKHTVVVDGVTYCRIRALRQIERPFGLPPWSRVT